MHNERKPKHMAVKESKKREKLLALATATILGSVFLFTTIIDPQLKKHKALASQFSQLQLELTRARGNLLIKDRIEKAYSQIEPLIAEQGNEQQQISDFTRLLDQIYSKLNVKIRSVKILPVADESHYQKLSIRIEMTGAVKDFLKFTEAVEQHLEPVRIEQFDLTCQETKDTVMASMIISKIISKKNIPSGKI
jgi:Tfp pilus assembly protein PilO